MSVVQPRHILTGHVPHLLFSKGGQDDCIQKAAVFDSSALLALRIHMLGHKARGKVRDGRCIALHGAIRRGISARFDKPK
jgi:hypothetical protein